MTVAMKPTGRCDVAFRRGADETIGVKWEERIDKVYEPKDLTGWTCTLTIEDDWGDELVTIPCSTTSDGYALAIVTASVMAAFPVTNGSWRIAGDSPSDGHDVLGWGYWEVV